MAETGVSLCDDVREQVWLVMALATSAGWMGSNASTGIMLRGMSRLRTGGMLASSGSGQLAGRHDESTLRDKK